MLVKQLVFQTLSQTQEHTVLKDAEMLPLVPAANSG
jgi:hypothetical protein